MSFIIIGDNNNQQKTLLCVFMEFIFLESQILFINQEYWVF